MGKKWTAWKPGCFWPRLPPALRPHSLFCLPSVWCSWGYCWWVWFNSEGLTGTCNSREKELTGSQKGQELTSRVWWCGICREPIGRPLLIRGGCGLLLARRLRPLPVWAKAPETPSEGKQQHSRRTWNLNGRDKNKETPFQPEVRCWETYWNTVLFILTQWMRDG